MFFHKRLRFATAKFLFLYFIKLYHNMNVKVNICAIFHKILIIWYYCLFISGDNNLTVLTLRKDEWLLFTVKPKQNEKQDIGVDCRTVCSLLYFWWWDLIFSLNILLYLVSHHLGFQTGWVALKCFFFFIFWHLFLSFLISWSFSREKESIKSIYRERQNGEIEGELERPRHMEDLWFSLCYEVWIIGQYLKSFYTLRRQNFLLQFNQRRWMSQHS